MTGSSTQVQATSVVLPCTHWTHIMFMKLGASSSLVTPVCSWIGSISSFKLDEDAKWWWYLKEKVFMTSAPETAFGEKEQWNIVSQLCSPLLMFSPLPPQDEYVISQITARQCHTRVTPLMSQTQTLTWIPPPQIQTLTWIPPLSHAWLA